MRSPWLLCAFFLVTAMAFPADLERVKTEANLEKRSRAALENAELALKEARQAYAQGDSKQASALLSEVQSSVELAETSLKETGKNPRKNPKYFKNAELKTRALLRTMEHFQQEMDVGDRSMLDAVRTKVQQVHEDMLLGVMTKPK